MNKQAIFEVRKKVLLFLRGPQMISNKCSAICFHLNRVGNGDDDISSEEHFGEIFEFYLVIQSF